MLRLVQGAWHYLARCQRYVRSVAADGRCQRRRTCQEWPAPGDHLQHSFELEVLQHAALVCLLAELLDFGLALPVQVCAFGVHRASCEDLSLSRAVLMLQVQRSDGSSTSVSLATDALRFSYSIS